MRVRLLYDRPDDFVLFMVYGRVCLPAAQYSAEFTLFMVYRNVFILYSKPGEFRLFMMYSGCRKFKPLTLKST